MRTTPLSAGGSLRFPAFPGPMGSHLLAFQFMLDQSQWWPPAVMLGHQCAQLGHLLRHAARTTPYYRELFARHGVAIPEQITPGFLATLPVTTREALQAAGDKFASTAPPKEHGPVQFSKTSGSTGRPLRFGKAMANQIIWTSLMIRDYRWHGGDFGRKFAGIRVVAPGQARPPAGARQADWGREVASVFRTGEAVMLDVGSRPSEQLDWLDREKPDLLLSLPSNLAALTDHAERHGRPLPRIPELRTYGEMVPPELRRRLESAWQAKLVDIYSCEEAGYLALQCPDHGHYHVQSESVWIEIVDEAGRACPPGVVGRVLVTNLNNFVTPLIRYEIGDYAEFGEPCPCGRGLPVLRRIHGRKRNRFVLPNGETISPSIGERKLVSLIPGLVISEFRCVQHTTSLLELQVVADRAVTAEEQARIADLMRASLGHPFEIRFTFPPRIERGPNAKFETFISLVSAPPAGPEMR